MTGEDIKKMRKELGMTQEHFAREVGVSYTTINRLENGKHKRASPLLQRAIEDLIRKRKTIQGEA